MIARVWRGRTRKEDAEVYLQVVRDTGLTDIPRTAGNQGAWLFQRMDGDHAEFLLVSLWDSFDSIKSFAGADVDKARYYADDDSGTMARIHHLTARLSQTGFGMGLSTSQTR